jgi:hypothetical protein
MARSRVSEVIGAVRRLSMAINTPLLEITYLYGRVASLMITCQNGYAAHACILDGVHASQPVFFHGVCDGTFSWHF